MKRFKAIQDERGTTMVEVLVSISTGLIVLVALTTVILVTLHSNARVSARVDATQRSRIALAKIMQELHSSCVEPKVAPILAGSSGTSLSFMRSVRAQGGEVAPKPVESVIELVNGVLYQTDYAATSEAQPWVFSETPIPPGPQQLMTNISPTSPSSSIFRYYAYAKGAISKTPLKEPLDTTTAAQTLLVEVAFDAAPDHTVTGDNGAVASVQESAALRLTPPSFSEEVEALPCQ